MSKAADAFRTISEVAAELVVPKHVLRFWEAKFPQIRPMKRGGGRRYYRPGDMELLRGIRHLLHAEGYTIKGVQKILREQGIDAVKLFGRGEAEAAPVTARSAADRSARVPRTGREPASPAPLPKANPAGAAAAAAASATSRELIMQMIAELEICRGLLQVERAATQSPREGTRAVRRPRAARG